MIPFFAFEVQNPIKQCKNTFFFAEIYSENIGCILTLINACNYVRVKSCNSILKQISLTDCAELYDDVAGG